jgi:hypothetical protein
MAAYKTYNFIVAARTMLGISKQHTIEKSYLSSSQRPSVARTKNRVAFCGGSEPSEVGSDIFRCVTTGRAVT